MAELDTKMLDSMPAYQALATLSKNGKVPYLLPTDYPRFNRIISSKAVGLAMSWDIFTEIPVKEIESVLEKGPLFSVVVPHNAKKAAIGYLKNNSIDYSNLVVGDNKFNAKKFFDEKGIKQSNVICFDLLAQHQAFRTISDESATVFYVPFPDKADSSFLKRDGYYAFTNSNSVLRSYFSEVVVDCRAR